MITPEHQQEALSVAYVYAIAAGAGMSCSVRNFDYGIDLTLHEVTIRTNPRTGRRRRFETGWLLDIQLKSTTAVSFEEEYVKYDLDIDAYDDLRNSNVLVPRILVLHHQPKTRERRLYQVEDALCSEGCCYWRSLKGEPTVTNASKVRVQIPRKNVLTVDQLKSIMERIHKQEPL